MSERLSARIGCCGDGRPIRGMVLALALSIAPDEQSFGIGVDVVPEAFTFAAKRIGFDPNLRLVACRPADCRWDVGDGVVLVATFHAQTLEIYEIEAVRAVTPARGTSQRFDKTCRTIVRLLGSGTSDMDQSALAAAITRPAEGHVQIPVSRLGTDLTFYGASSPSDSVARCGASAKPDGALRPR